MARSDCPEIKKEQARAMFAMGKSIQEVARTVGMSPATAKKIKDQLDNMSDFQQLRAQKKAEFIEKAWEVVMLATQQAKAKIEKAGPGEAAKVAGIFYDKIALAMGEATGRHEIAGPDGQPFEVNIRVIE